MPVIFIGPPGAGKGRQADKLQERRGLYHLESSRVIEDRIREGLRGDPTDPVMLREQKIWSAGTLNTPELVKQWMANAIRTKAAQGNEVLFSGSPRTVEEAESLIPLLEQLYGSESIVAFNMEIDLELSIKRNLDRLICLVCRYPYAASELEAPVCLRDGTTLTKRDVDSDEEKMRHRYQQYLLRTAPILQYLADRGYCIHPIDGDQHEEAVYKDIVHVLRNR